MANYVAQLQPELAVNHCRLVVVWVDDPASTRAARQELGATFPFLCDRERHAGRRNIVRATPLCGHTDRGGRRAEEHQSKHSQIIAAASLPGALVSGGVLHPSGIHREQGRRRDILAGYRSRCPPLKAAARRE